jgi:pimeloyl-ACP methyl ester carboxylesterase
LAKPRLRQSALGFSGLGGIAWIASMIADSTPITPEDLTCADLLGPEVQVASVDGESVAYHEEGQGEPALVFVHGFSERLQIWQPVQQALSARHRTVALDLWGFGASARPAHAQPRDWVRQVTGLMDQLGLVSAILVGHSLGGRVSLMTARAAPERVQRLVLCDADWGQAAHGYVMAWLLSHSPAIPRILGKIRASDQPLRRMLKLTQTPNYPFTEAMIEALRRPLRVQGTARCWQSLSGAPPLRDLRGLPETVSCPALVIWGEDDPIVPLWAGQKLARRLATAELKVIPDCGHFPQEEYPAMVAEFIRGFVEK